MVDRPFLASTMFWSLFLLLFFCCHPALFLFLFSHVCKCIFWQIVNQHLLKDLTERDLWNEALKNKLVAANGSIQVFFYFNLRDGWLFASGGRGGQFSGTWNFSPLWFFRWAITCTKSVIWQKKIRVVEKNICSILSPMVPLHDFFPAIFVCGGTFCWKLPKPSPPWNMGFLICMFSVMY